MSLTPQFFANTPLDLLFREGVRAEMFTRFKLGRTLDGVHAYGCDRLFSELALAVCVQEGIEEFANHDSGGPWGHACSVLTTAWLAMYEREDCTTSPNDSVVYVDYYVLAARDIDDLHDFNDFNDKVRCVRACVPSGHHFGFYEHQHQSGLAWEPDWISHIDERPLSPSSPLYQGVTSADMW